MKKLLSVLMVLAIMVTSLTCVTVTASAASDWDGYIKITNASQLKKMDGSSGKFYLAKDIDLSDEMWTSISSFSGTLDGNGHCIKNLKSKGDGLFMNLSNAEIRNLGIKDVKINHPIGSNGGYFGALASQAEYTTISNCYVTGDITMEAEGFTRLDVGGFIGSCITADSNCFLKMTDCINLVNISCSGRNVLCSGFVGSIFVFDGYTPSVVFTNCVNAGNITSPVSNAIMCDIGDDYYSPKLTSCYNVASKIKDMPLFGYGTDNLIMKNCATVTSLDISNPSASCMAQADVDVAASAFKKKSTYKGFDFNKTWKIGADGYAVLRIMDTAEAKESAEFSYFTVTLKKGEKLKLGTVVAPTNAKLTWKSSKTSVATVSSKGTVTAKKAGSAIITVKSGDASMKLKVVVTK